MTNVPACWICECLIQEPDPSPSPSPTEGVVIWGLAFGALIYMGSNLFARSNVESMLVTYHNNIDDVLQNNANGYGVSVWGLMAGDMTFVTGMNGHEIDWITQEINYPYTTTYPHGTQQVENIGWYYNGYSDYDMGYKNTVYFTGANQPDWSSDMEWNWKYFELASYCHDYPL